MCEVAGGSGRRRVQGTYKGKKISRTHVQIIVRVFSVVGEFKKRITRLDTSLSLFFGLWGIGWWCDVVVGRVIGGGRWSG